MRKLHDFFFSPSKELTEKYRTIPRFTYRSNFQPIPGTNLTTDARWGCCFRSSQTLIAMYFKKLYYHNSKKFGENTKIMQFLKQDNDQNYSLLSLFEDTILAPFSIHNLVLAASIFDVKPGSWAKPSNVASSIKKLFQILDLNCIANFNTPFDPTNILEEKYPLLLLISLRLGLNTIDPDYLEFIKAYFSIEENLGLVSGQGGSSYYFVNIEQDNLLSYYDPHVVQNAATKIDDHLTFYNQRINTMPFDNLNPSILLGFACLDPESTYNFLVRLSQIPITPISISKI